MASCPKCGSRRFHYELRSGGTRSSTTYYRTGRKGWFTPSGKRHHKSTRQTISVGICPDCGYTTRKNTGSTGMGCLGLIDIVLIIYYFGGSGSNKAPNVLNTTTPYPTSTLRVEMSTPNTTTTGKTMFKSVTLTPTLCSTWEPSVTRSQALMPTARTLKNLSVGDKGLAVKELQDALIERGYLSSEYASGSYDDMTRLAVLAFQIDHDIPATGNADILTQRTAMGQ